jgi:general secretion pathway protein M
MKLHLTKTQGRLAAIGILVAMLLLLAFAFSAPIWWLHKRYDDKIEEYSDQLQRYSRVAILRPAIENSLQNVEKLDPRKYYIKSNTPTLAAAELQDLLTRIIEGSQGRMVSSQALPNKDEKMMPGPAKVAISIQMNAPIVPLQLILHAIEDHTPSLFIEQLTVRANQGRGYKPTPGVQPEFSVQMTVSGYSLNDGVKP